MSMNVNSRFEENQLHPELLNICWFNPFLQHDSSQRVYMTSNHLGQMLVVKGATQRRIQTGAEREYGKYTFNVKMPCDGEILAIVPRYASTLGQDSINHNPQTVVIYEDASTREVGIINLTDYCSNHQYFGFPYKKKDGYSQLRVGALIPKDTVFLDSPNIDDDGGYKYGVELNMALMTHPAASEDGVLISESALKKLAFNTYDVRVVEWGSRKFALNLYGDENNYKPFPDIGDYIREDGLLMALRSYEPDLLAPVEQSVKDVMKPDIDFDTTIYANGPGGRIVDIKIHHDVNKSGMFDPVMDKQPKKYDDSRRIFYSKILSQWSRLHKARGDNLKITPEFQRLIVEALSVVNETNQNAVKTTKLYRKAPLDEYRVEFTIEYTTIPGTGFKITDLHGGKGVICQVSKDEHMPVDEEGNRADIVMDPNSTVSRMNLGRVYEMYFNAASRDTHKRLLQILSLPLGISEVNAFNAISKLDPSVVDSAFNYLLNYYKIVSPVMYGWFESGQVGKDRIKFLSEICNKGIYLYMPTNNQPETTAMVQQIENSPYRPVYGKVSYVGNSSMPVVTKNNVRIASMYFILLEKIGDDWSSVSSCKLSHFGVLSQLTKGDKFSKPVRNQAVRGAGEAEVRIFSSYVGEKFTVEMMDRNNNPKAHKEAVKNIISSPTPSNMQVLIDRTKVPYGGSKPISLIKHLASVGGWEFRYKKYEANWKA